MHVSRAVRRRVAVLALVIAAGLRLGTFLALRPTFDFASGGTLHGSTAYDTYARNLLSTGVYGYPKQPATEIAVREVKAHEGGVERVIFCCFGADMAALYREVTARTG